MRVNTERFGEINIDSDRIIYFPEGVYGIPYLKKYFIVDYKEPIKWLHSVDSPSTAFIIADPFKFFPAYTFVIEDDVERFLDIKTPKDVVVFVLLKLVENKVVADLRYPIVVNALNKKAKQLVLDSEKYRFRPVVSD
jgi:flagellar assembly factor FliW